MFLGQIEVDPTQAKQYFDTHGAELLPEAGLYHKAAEFKSAVATGKINELENRINAHVAEMNRKIDQLNSMGKPSGPGAVRDQLNVQSQILFNQNEANRLMYEREQIIGTMDTYGPLGVQLKYAGPETTRTVEIIGTGDLKAPNAAEAFTQAYAGQATNMLLPGAGGILGNKTMGDIARYGIATFTLGLSEVIPKFFGGGGKPSGEGVKAWVVDPGKEFSRTEAAQKLMTTGKADTQAIYSPALDAPILTKIARPTDTSKAATSSAQTIQQGAVQAKAVYGSLLSEYPQTPSWWPFIGSVAFAWWLLYEVTKK